MECSEAVEDAIYLVAGSTDGIVHDVNNMLMVALSSLERIDDCRPEEALKVRKYAESARHAVYLAAELIMRLRGVSRQRSDQKPISVNELLFESEGLIGSVAGERSEIVILMDQHLWVCDADPVQLKAALINIVLNGRDAMPDGGVLTVETLNIVLPDGAVAGCLPGCYVSVSVTDSGGGMSGELQCRAFEPYFTTKSIGEGTGLGLSMVYGFARQSGGSVTIEGDLGRGTTVTLYLPVSEQRRISAVE